MSTDAREIIFSFLKSKNLGTEDIDKLTTEDLREIFRLVWKKKYIDFCLTYGVSTTAVGRWINYRTKYSRRVEDAVKKLIKDILASQIISFDIMQINYSPFQEKVLTLNPYSYSDMKLFKRKSGIITIFFIEIVEKYIILQILIEYFQKIINKFNNDCFHVIFTVPSSMSLPLHIYEYYWFDILSQILNPRARNIFHTYHLHVTNLNYMLPPNIKFFVYTKSRQWHIQEFRHWLKFYNVINREIYFIDKNKELEDCINNIMLQSVMDI